jgi:cob(I)alamin adenosyltransferase
MTENQPPTEAPPRGDVREPSLVLINTGDGKGKSTAAFGTLLRAVSRGWKVGVIQFLKSGDWQVGEEKTLTSLGVDWWSMGDGFTWDSEDIEESEATAREAWAQARELIGSGEYDVVLLDEVTYPINWEWIDIAEVVGTITERPRRTSVILTGRDAPQSLVDIADTVTEMVKVKHAYDRGVMARRGIDY